MTASDRLIGNVILTISKLDMRRYLTVLVLSFLAVTVVRAQDLRDNLSVVTDEYSRQYVAPLIDAYGATINAGLFHTAKVGGGLLPMVDVYLGVKVFGAMLPADRSFSLSYQSQEVYVAPNGQRFVVPVTYQIDDAPTVFGQTDPGNVSVTINETIPGPDGTLGTADDIVINDVATMQLLPGLVNIPVVPLLVPQVGLGSFRGTDVIIRYLPTIETESLGSISFRGAGVRHSISQYIPLFPADISAQLAYQRLATVDKTDRQTLLATAYAGNIAVSKSFTEVTFYGGLQLEKTSVKVDYDFDTGQPELGVQTIRFSQQARNRTRVIAGFSFTPGAVQLNVDYALGSTNTFTAGVGIVL